MKLSSPLIAVLLCIFLSACRLELEVPTSGSLSTTSGNVSCAAGEVCSVDIMDVYFDETFVANPGAGFMFNGWAAKHRGLCAGRTTPCHLYTSFFEGNEALTGILNDAGQEFYLEPDFRSTGFNSLFIGHSFFMPFADGMPFHAAQNSLVGHAQSTVFSGGAGGAPEALWNDSSKRAEIQAILDGGDVELFVMTYHPDYPDVTGYVNWIDYTLAQNPNARIAVALPWSTFPAETSAAAYESDWHDFHSTTIHSGVDYLRSLYPGTDIFCIPYGQSAIELRNLFEAGNLDDVDALIGSSGDTLFRDNAGHADDLLIDLGRLVWLDAIYEIDLSSYSHNPGYSADLKAIAMDIMATHDPAYDAPYR